MTPKRAAYVAASVTFGAVAVVSFGRAAIGGWGDLLINAPFLTVQLGAPLAAAAGILTYCWRTATDSPDTDLAGPGDEWTAAIRRLVFFAVGAVAAKRLRSFSRGLVLTTAVAVVSAVAMLPAAVTESVYWCSESGVLLLDGERRA